MTTLFTYARTPMVAFIVVTALAFAFGGPALAFTVAVLAILEISLSFDNAVVNARILQSWPDRWRKRFLGVGIIVAVFGMRLAFPIAIVAVAAQLSPVAVLNMAVNQPQTYAATLTTAHPMVSAFGGTFLLLVALEYFFDQDKESDWIAPVESALRKVGLITLAESAVAVVALLAFTNFAPVTDRMAYLAAGLVGIVLFSATKTIGTITGGGDAATKAIAATWGGFLYLEMLDASFSFDGVIGAFALTDRLIWIMAGLGIGALAVRQMTLLAVDRGALTEFPHLENGAFWAILALSLMMLADPVYPLPEAVKGLCGAGFILAAFITSILANRRALARA